MAAPTKPNILLIVGDDMGWADVSWHDPLVGSHQGEKSAEIESYDVAIVAVAHDSIDKEKLKNSAAYLFDCTGTMTGVNGL